LPKEGIIASMTPQKEGWLSTDLDFLKIDEVRKNGQVFNFQAHQKISVSLADENISVRRIII
jgi:hypothetical protein